MLSFKNVTKTFKLDEQTNISPIQGLSLEIDPGELIVIIGRSGTGKTTLLNLATGLLKPTSGHVAIDQRDLTEMNDRQISTLRSSTMGFVFQFPSLLPSLTVRDNVAVPAMFATKNGAEAAKERAGKLLSEFGIGDKMDVFPRQLSAGQQKRAVIARALINQPKIVLADEPTSDLDVRTEKEVMSTIRDINSTGVAFLIMTHSLELISFAGRAFEMANGRLKQIK